MYRNFLDNRCKDNGLQPLNWKEWNYVHKKVDNRTQVCTSDSDTHTIIVMVFTCLQDQPLQTNSFDCGVFASQVKPTERVITVWLHTNILSQIVCMYRIIILCVGREVIILQTCT